MVSRLVAPIGAGEGNARYYADLLQVHLGIVAVRACARPGCGRRTCRCCWRRRSCRTSSAWRSWSARARPRATRSTIACSEHRSTLASAEVRRDLLGGILRLRVTAGESWRTVLTPDAERGAISLPEAMRAGAIVLVRTWVDDLPDEARAITTLFLADAAAAALTLPGGRAVGGADRRVRRRALKRRG